MPAPWRIRSIGWRMHDRDPTCTAATLEHYSRGLSIRFETVNRPSEGCIIAGLDRVLGPRAVPHVEVRNGLGNRALSFTCRHVHTPTIWIDGVRGSIQEINSIPKTRAGRGVETGAGWGRGDVPGGGCLPGKYGPRDPNVADADPQILGGDSWGSARSYTQNSTHAEQPAASRCDAPPFHDVADVLLAAGPRSESRTTEIENDGMGIKKLSAPHLPVLRSGVVGRGSRLGVADLDSPSRLSFGVSRASLGPRGRGDRDEQRERGRPPT